MDNPSTENVTEGCGLMFYREAPRSVSGAGNARWLRSVPARWYDPSLGCFAQADSVVPDGMQGYDRYAYTNNNPINATDPTDI